MTNLPIIFSDVSFNPQIKIAVWGFLQNNIIYYGTLFNTSNIKAEIYAFEMAKKSAGCDCLFCTDCQEVMSIGKLQGLNMLKIKGHKPSKMKTDIDKRFSIIDKFVRKKLRAIIKKTQSYYLAIENDSVILKNDTDVFNDKMDNDIIDYPTKISLQMDNDIIDYPTRKISLQINNKIFSC